MTSIKKIHVEIFFYRRENSRDRRETQREREYKILNNTAVRRPMDIIRENNAQKVRPLSAAESLATWVLLRGEAFCRA